MLAVTAVGTLMWPRRYAILRYRDGLRKREFGIMPGW
jgi:hypothetical protein